MFRCWSGWKNSSEKRTSSKRETWSDSPPAFCMRWRREDSNGWMNGRSRREAGFPCRNGAADAEEPGGALLKALDSGAWEPLADARSFSAKLSDLRGNRTEVVLRRVHSERRHSVTLDLTGSWTKATVKDLTGSLAQRLGVARST